MNKISSFQQYKDIIATAKQNGYNLSNCFFLPPEINQKIEKGTLLFKHIQNGLLLFDDLIDFYRCYYFLSASSDYKKISLDKNAVIEFPFNNALNEKQLLQIKKIETMGFSLGRKSSVMYSAPNRINVYNNDQSNKICCTADEQDLFQVYDLMKLCFNPLFSFLPTLQELSNVIKEGKVLVIRDDGKIAAALISGFAKKIATIHLVAVNPVYRGKNFGKAIVQAYHNKYKEEAGLFQQWVDLKNMPAINMYQYFGYKFGLRKANEYIYIVKENQ